MTRNMTRALVVLGAGAALLLLAAATMAQPGFGPGGRGHGGPPSIDAIFGKLDANQDGKLTKDELPERAAEKLMVADADGDGAVTKEELEQARPGRGGGGGFGGPGGPPPIESLFERFDKNGDGKLTQDEVPEWCAERLMKADADGDGAVTKEELEQARQKLGGEFADKLFERLDANADGKLTKDELPPRLADKLMQAEADGDGALTKDELKAAREKLGPRPGAGRFRGGPGGPPA